MIYFYCCSYPLRANSIIEKGNWGRICRLEKERPVENTFERIRQQEFPDRPSRFECVFLCPTLENARFFISETKRKFDLIYEVELVDSDSEILETDWTLVNTRLLDTEAKQENAARKYWNPEHIEERRKEILANSAVRIIRCVS